jgi:hypothetical protein
VSFDERGWTVSFASASSTAEANRILSLAYAQGYSTEPDLDGGAGVSEGVSGTGRGSARGDVDGAGKASAKGAGIAGASKRNIRVRSRPAGGSSAEVTLSSMFTDHGTAHYIRCAEAYPRSYCRQAALDRVGESPRAAATSASRLPPARGFS